jgi:hypothetical protein
MSSYIDSPNQGAIYLQKGVATYLFGSFNYKQSNTQMRVTNIVGDGTTATLTVQIYGGEIPIVGNLVSVSQTTTSSGAFNVNRAALTAVSINALGAGTISFLSATSVSSTPDAGTAIAEVAEIPETLAAGASIAACLESPECDSQKTIPLAVTFTTKPTAVTVTLQVALRNVDAEFTNTTTAVTVAGTVYTAGPVVQATLQRGYFYRVIVSGLTIGSGVGLVVKIGG